MDAQDICATWRIETDHPREYDDMKVRWTLTEEEFDAQMEEGYWVEKMRPHLGQVGEQREEDGLVEFGDSIYRIPECHLQAV